MTQPALVETPILMLLSNFTGRPETEESSHVRSLNHYLIACCVDGALYAICASTLVILRYEQPSAGFKLHQSISAGSLGV